MDKEKEIDLVNPCIRCSAVQICSGDCLSKSKYKTKVEEYRLSKQKDKTNELLKIKEQVVKEFAEKLKADLNNAYVNATTPFQTGKNAGLDNALILIDERIEKSYSKGEG